MELAGQAAIVTGGGRGIGRATALELARLGAGAVELGDDDIGAQSRQLEGGGAADAATGAGDDRDLVPELHRGPPSPPAARRAPA